MSDQVDSTNSNDGGAEDDSRLNRRDRLAMIMANVANHGSHAAGGVALVTLPAAQMSYNTKDNSFTVLD